MSLHNSTSVRLGEMPEICNIFIPTCSGAHKDPGAGNAGYGAHIYRHLFALQHRRLQTIIVGPSKANVRMLSCAQRIILLGHDRE